MSEWKQEISERLASLKLTPAREAEIIEELAQHLEDRYTELLAGGVFGVSAAAPLTIVAATSLMIARLISTRLFVVSAADPLTIAVATLLMLGVAALAAFLPARRASRVDPMIARRCE